MIKLCKKDRLACLFGNKMITELNGIQTRSGRRYFELKNAECMAAESRMTLELNLVIRVSKLFHFSSTWLMTLPGT